MPLLARSVLRPPTSLSRSVTPRREAVHLQKSWMRLRQRWRVTPVPSALVLECGRRQLAITYSRWISGEQLVLRHLLQPQGVSSSPLLGQLLGDGLLLDDTLEVFYQDLDGHQVAGLENVGQCARKVRIGSSLPMFRQVRLGAKTASLLRRRCAFLTHHSPGQ